MSELGWKELGVRQRGEFEGGSVKKEKREE